MLGRHNIRPPHFASKVSYSASPQTSAECPRGVSCGDAAHDKRTKREKERPERAASSQPRATPWVSAYKRLRPVRAKVWANGWLLLLPLQGVGNGDMVPRALSWACSGLIGLSARAGPHNRLLRRQHCSSLCSQSEGHEHVANIASALRHDFVGFLAVFGRHNIRPPSLCEQSELQCFASDLRRMFAQRRNRHAIWLKTAQRFSQH